MWRRWVAAPALLLLVSAPSLGGCVEILDLGRFRVGDEDASTTDGGFGARDAGEDAGFDGGFDACVPTTYYADRDGDGHGDPTSAMSACTAPDGYVTDGDDCDDGDPEIHPGASERCDGIDQDCDGAIDEGLIGPLGNWIEVVSDLGSGFWTRRAVAHRDGATVMWRTESEDVLRASFFDRDGAALQTSVLLAGNGTQHQLVTRFGAGGLEQVIFAWTYPDRIVVTACSTSGVCDSEIVIVSGDTADVSGLAVAQQGSRLLAYWVAVGHLYMVSLDPRTRERSEVLVVAPPSPGSTGYLGLATVAADEPYALIARVSGVTAGGVTAWTPWLIRIRGERELLFSEPEDALEWDSREACASLGGTECVTVLAPLGAGVPGTPSLALGQQVFASEGGVTTGSASCFFGATPQVEGWPMFSECINAEDFKSTSIRGTVMTVLMDLGTDYVIRDVPLGPEQDGSELVRLPGISARATSFPTLSMHRGRGIAYGRTAASGRNDLSFIRLGCEP